MTAQLPPLVRLTALLDCIPIALKTLYNGHSEGKYEWLTRTGPDGRRTRELWVNIQALEKWAQARGLLITIRTKGGIQRH